MKKKMLTLSFALMSAIALAACETETDPVTIGEPKTEEKGEAVVGKEQEVVEEARNLFSNLINLEALRDESEAKTVLDETLAHPKDYLDSLKKNDIELQFGRYEKAQAAFRDETVKRLDNGNYEYHAFTTVDMYMDRGSEPISSPFEVTLEVGYDTDAKAYRIVETDIRPQ